MTEMQGAPTTSIRVRGSSRGRASAGRPPAARRRTDASRAAAAVLLTVGLAALAGPTSAGAAGGADGRACGKLDDTRSVELVAYSVSCGKASDVVKRAVRRAVTSSSTRRVRGTYLGFSCRGTASSRRISVTCRRGGGAQFLSARGAF